MPILEKYEKQPGETQDYDIDFNEYLSALGDTAVDHEVIVEAGLTLVASMLVDGVVKVFVSGGVSGQKYKVTVRITTATTPPRVREGDIEIKVKES